MEPTISQVLSVEMIRDGGSLAVVWADGTGQEHWLFYPVRIEPVDADHNRIAGWGEPEIHNRGAGVNERIAWRRARSLITEFRTLIVDPQDILRLNAMDDIAIREGEITPSSQAAFYSVGTPRRVFRPPTGAPSDA